jgi:atypical dual specificity phosphatase
MVKIGNLYRWIYGRLKGRPTNFYWIIEGKLAGSGIPMSSAEVRWLVKQKGIRSIVTLKDKPLSREWFSNSANKSSSTIANADYFHLSLDDKSAPSLEELDHVVNYIRRQIDNGKAVMVHCSGGKGRTGTILAAYLVKKELDSITARQAIDRISKIRGGESIQSKDQERIILSYETYLKSERKHNNV